MRRAAAWAALCLPLLAITGAADLHGRTIAPHRAMRDHRDALARGDYSAAALVRYYRQRIDRLDRKGPKIRSVLALNPDVARDARSSGRQSLRRPLEGIPILLKDNIDVQGMPTTAGSLALEDNRAIDDAFIVTRLRAQGAIILGKANLSEWAHFRSREGVAGWSAVGDATRNPHVLDRSPCSSSAGSAAAVSADFVAAAVGTETNGSIICPAAMNGIVGMKPTLGLVSRSGIVPLSSSQDTPGPMARTVEDAALLLSAMAAPDPADPVTYSSTQHAGDLLGGLRLDSLKDVRLGVVRPARRPYARADQVFEAALENLRAAGAILVEIPDFDEGPASAHQLAILLGEFRIGIDAYLADRPHAVKLRSLEDLVRFNQSTPRETALFGQELLEASLALSGNWRESLVERRAEAHRLAGRDGIDRLLQTHDVRALVGRTADPAPPIDYAGGGGGGGGSAIGSMAAIAGYPHITVPMGDVRGLPVGLSFIGPAWSDAELLGYAFAFEQRAPARRLPAFLRTLADDAALAAPLADR